ncbi:Tat pathway signal sequence domain protein, partial [Catenibacterium mitsuokai DSM 15897]
GGGGGMGRGALHLALVRQPRRQPARARAALDPRASAPGPLRRRADRSQPPRIGLAGDAGGVSAGDQLDLVHLAGDLAGQRRAAADRPHRARVHVDPAQSAGRPADGGAGLPGRSDGAGAGLDRGAGLPGLAAALDGRGALGRGDRVRPGADLAAGMGHRHAAPADRAGRLRLPVGGGDHDHHRVRLLRRADRTRAAGAAAGVAVFAGRRRHHLGRLRPPVPGRALAQRPDRRHLVRHFLAAGAGHRLSPPRRPLVLDAAAGVAVLQRVRGRGAVA